MLSPELLHDYQKNAANTQCRLPHSMLWMSMGLGKTVVTLSSILYLTQIGFLRGVLVIAPIRVAQTVWDQEALKWSHTKDIKFSKVLGTKDQRIRGLLKKADVYLINYENLRWLSEVLHTYFISKKKSIPFNGIVFDEVTKCKDTTTERVKSFMKIINYFEWSTGLTGTPAPNGYKDLHGQYLVLDKGQRLGRYKTAYEAKFFHKVGPYKIVPYHDTTERIKSLIGDITLEMSAKDYNPLPDFIVNDIALNLPNTLRKQYDELEKELFVRLDSGVDVEVFNAAALSNKLLQFCNGFIYPTPGIYQWERIHDIKLNALEDILEEASGQPVLCSYSYRADAERIMLKFKDLRPINLTDCKSEKSVVEAMNRWKSGDCPLMVGHPASMGHGIDGLQDNGHIIVWFGLNWSLDLYEQFNARICRQGQPMPVVCHRLLINDTLDQAQSLAIKDKGTAQETLRDAIKEYRKDRMS